MASYRKYRYMDQNLTQRRRGLEDKIPDIKKAIDVLLEKEYMERVDGAKNMFAYVA